MIMVMRIIMIAIFVDISPTTINKNEYAYVESINSFMHVAHDKNVLCDSYVVNLIHDATSELIDDNEECCLNML